MSKYSETYGVDISKDVFDVANTTGFYRQYPNTVAGFKKFIKELEKSAIVVMEATGYYHYRLAQFLYKNGVLVSSLNTNFA